MQRRNCITFLILQLCSLFRVEQGFYVPGVAPVEFRDGDPIEVKVRIFSNHSCFRFKKRSHPNLFFFSYSDILIDS